MKGDKKAMSEQQVRGMSIFAAVGCTSCHSGAAFNGPTLPQLLPTEGWPFEYAADK